MAVAVTMLVVPLQASATHNSFGTRMEITQGDEVDPDTGALAPDIADGGHIDEKANVYHLDFANDNDLPAREGPLDQSGAAYDTEQCRPFSQFQDEAQGTEHSPIQLYEAALPGVDSDIEEEKDACWVGYLDNQKEYTLALTAIGQRSWDPLYFLNPAQDDENCQHGDYFLSFVEGGEERREGCGSPDDVPVVDTPLPSSTNSHKAWWPGSWHSAAIDTDHLEAAIGGDDGTNCQEASCTGTDVAANFEGDGEDFHGSGTLTLPLAVTSTTFLFGYPHPDNPDAGDYDVGPSDAPFSQPLWGVPDSACGTADDPRIPTDACQLLGPKDLHEYDVKFDEGLEEDERGRLCSFSPDNGIANPDGLAGGPCGLFGTEITTFIEDTDAGGFGTGTVATYQSTFPGWRNPLLDPFHAGMDSSLFLMDPFGTENSTGLFGIPHADYDERRGADTSVYFDRGVFAVNPKVPQVEDKVSCVRPNIHTDGEVVPSGPHAGASAPGVYGTYQAAAIDVDIYVGGANAPVMGGLHDGEGIPGYEGYHETFGPALETADDSIGTLLTTAANVLDEADDASEQVVDELPEDTPADELVDEAFETTGTALDTAFNTSDRVGPTETSDPEPSNELGPQNWDFSTVEIPEGVSCQAGLMAFTESGGEKGVGLRMDNQVDRHTVALKDPTILDDANLPAREDNTTDGTWQVDSHEFSTPLLSYVDENLDESFSGCAPDDGSPSPSQDSCPWTGTWDAYNPECTGSESENECEDLLRQDGYVLTEEDLPATAEPDRGYGVGAVATVEVSGTTLLWRDNIDNGPVNTVEEYRILNQDPTQSTCVILTSIGFKDKLATHVGPDVGSLDDGFDAEDRTTLCPDHTDDRIEVWHDAFLDQGGPNDGGLTSAVEWAKLTPTPDAVRENMDMQDDRLCLSFVFSTSEEVLGSGVAGTEDNIGLGADSTTTYYTDCDLLTSHEDEDGEPTDDHPLDAKTTTFPDYSKRDPDYRG